MPKKLSSIASICGIVLMLLAGCSSSSANESYAGILVIDGEQYILQGDVKDGEFTLGEKIGEVEKKEKIDVIPKDDYSSNYLEEGEEVYFSNENPDILIVKLATGELEIMKRGDHQ